MKAIVIVVALIAGLGVGPHRAHAGELDLVINGHARHLGTGDQWNEDNAGLGVEYHADQGTHGAPFLAANVFRDSRNNQSWQVGGGYLWRVTGHRSAHCDAGAVAFLMSRPSYHQGRPFPGALPALSCEAAGLGANAVYIPAGIFPNQPAVWFFQIKLSLGTF